MQGPISFMWVATPAVAKHDCLQQRKLHAATQLIHREPVREECPAGFHVLDPVLLFNAVQMANLHLDGDLGS